MNGKGSGRRPESEPGNYASGYDRIFASIAQASAAARAELDEAERIRVETDGPERRARDRSDRPE